MSSQSSNFKHGFPTPGPQTPTGDKVMDQLFFLSQTEFKRVREEHQYDIIIVGSGFCSLAVADRALKNDPHCRILILERGKFFLPTHFQNLPMPFASTIGGLSETFPWTLSSKTAQGGSGTIRWQHGMVPFFGGRSTLWSAWCPEPTREEMHGWPEETIQAMMKYIPSAKELLRVQRTDEVDVDITAERMKVVCGKRPVYGAMQSELQNLLENPTTEVQGIYGSEPAPIASDGKHDNGIDFEKFSVPGDLISLVTKQSAMHEKGTGAPLHIATNCIVEKIYLQDKTATALETSRGVVSIGNAKLVLAMGTLPPATLVQNSFTRPLDVGKRFSAHFISSIIARVPRKDFQGHLKFGDLEIGAFYIRGKGKDYTQQFHIQMSVISDKKPHVNAETALRYMPDVVATASMEQLTTSKDCVVFVCAVLGELDANNQDNWFLKHNNHDMTANSMLQITENENDRQTWNAMDEGTFGILEKVLSPKGANHVEYWHGSANSGSWIKRRPTEKERRVDALVHESSTLHIGADDDAPVDLNYRLRWSENIFVTGGGLWPLGGSWNPTLGMVALAQHLTDQLVPPRAWTQRPTDEVVPPPYKKRRGMKK